MYSITSGFDFNFIPKNNSRSNLDMLKEIVDSQFRIDPDPIKPEANFVKDLGADSLDVVEIVLMVEFYFNMDDTAANQIAFIQDILDYLELWDKFDP